MPTSLPRISVVRDPELGDALKLAGERLSAKSEAARLRELALIGARSLGASDPDLEDARAGLDELGATAERRELLSVSRKLRGRDRGIESPSDALRWVRGPR